MSQRPSGYARKERDLYETPEWVTEALIPFLPAHQRILEPAAGTGRIARVLKRHTTINTMDVKAHDSVDDVADFLQVPEGNWNGIVTNPPYDQAEAFCEHALRLMESTGGFVAMLLRTDFDHAKSRTHLFRDCPAYARKIVLLKRIVWFVEDNGKPKASPSYNHAWFLWNWKQEGPATLAYAA